MLPAVIDATAVRFLFFTLAAWLHQGIVKLAKTRSTHPQDIAISSDLEHNILGIDLGGTVKLTSNEQAPPPMRR